MSNTLTWSFLTQAHMARIANSYNDPPAIKTALLQAEKEARSDVFERLEQGPRDALLDTVYHLLRFGKGHNMTAEKQSALVSIFLNLHEQAMSTKASSQDAFAILEDLLVGHSVHRPPYSAAVFAVDDTKHIVDYLLSTYLRHYKLYLYTFSPRSEVHLTTSTVGVRTERVTGIPALMEAVPLAQWESSAAAAAKKADEERQAREAAAAAAAAEEAARLKAESEGPPMPEGLRAQLAAIRSEVAKGGDMKLSELDQRLAAIEAKLAADAAKPTSAVGSKGRRK